MSTEQLDKLLREELDRKAPSGAFVRTLLQVLWEREKDMPPEITPGIEAAWERFRERESAGEEPDRKRRHPRRWFLRLGTLAAVLAVVFILFIPGKAEADSLFTKLAKWSDSVVDFFSPDRENKNLLEYEFKSTNSGLIQVYNTLRELDVTIPVVPSWIPESYELVECKITETTHKKGMFAYFNNAEKHLVFKVDVFGEDVSHEYQRDEKEFTVYEFQDVTHTILRNNDRWVVIWFQENVECFLTVDCAEDTLYEILKSIYVTEDIHETTD